MSYVSGLIAGSQPSKSNFQSFPKLLKIKERLKLIVLEPGKAEKGLGSSKRHF
jgi:hypothetical protein